MGARPLTTDPQHRDGGLVQLDEDAVVDLPQTEELQHLLHLGRNLKLESYTSNFSSETPFTRLVDTTDPHSEGEFRVAGDVVVTLLASLAPQPSRRNIYSKKPVFV